MRLLLSIIVLPFLSTAQAVGAGLGASELNILYIAKNSPTLIVDSTSKQQSFLNAYKRILKSEKLQILFQKKVPGVNQAFTIGEDPCVWILYVDNLTAYDLDFNGDLDLSESVLLLMDVFQSQYQLHSAEYESLREKVLERLQARNQTHTLQVNQLPLSWKAFGIESDQVVILNYWGKASLRLPKSFIYRGLRLENPYVKFAERKSGVTVMLLGASGRYECPDSEILCESPMLIKLRYLHKEARLEFVEMGAVR